MISDINITSLAFSQNPYLYYDILRKEGNVHHLKSSSCWLVIGYDEIIEILTNIEKFTSLGAAHFDPLLLGCDPPAHTKHRKILEGTQGAFAKNRINALEEKIRKTSITLLENIKHTNSFDVVADFASPLSSLVILDILGIIPDDADELREWTQTAVSNKSIHNANFATTQWEMLKPFVEKWVSQAQKEKQSGALSEIMYHPDAIGYFSSENIVDLAKILLIGGNETTPNLISSVLRILLSDQQLFETIKESRSLIPNLIHETLRIEAPTQLIHRHPKEDVVIGGKLIPAGSLIALSIGAANRDSTRFKNPDKFDIYREEGKILSFGFGPHYCIGAHLAKLEATVAIDELLNHFPQMNIPEEFHPVYHFSSHVRGMKHLPLFIQKNNGEEIDSVREKALQFIQSSVVLDGEIPTLEYFPNFEPKKHKGWHYTFPSPFIHANVMYALLNSGNKKAIELAQKSAYFLLKTKERGSVWRFWNLNNCENPVPPDIDDTSICSLVLEKLGYELNNKKLLQRNIQPDGRFSTWIFPSKALLLRNPLLFFKLRSEQKIIAPTLNNGMLHPDDSEVGVSVNALMYLGKNIVTQPAIQRCIEDWIYQTDSFNFYGEKIVVAYHISRAYKEGISSFGQLADNISEMIEKEIDGYVFSELLLAYLSLSYFGKNGFLIQHIKQRIQNYCLLNENIFENYPYFTSKDRVFYAGSPSLTASWFLEATNKFEQHH